MKKLLFITNHVDPAAVGGRGQLSKLIADALAEICGDQFGTFELSEESGASVRERLMGHVDGATRRGIASVIEGVNRLNVDQIFLNGSNLGRVAEGVRAACPRVEIVAFFHNCEARFFLGALRQNPSVRALGVLVANYRAERLTVRFSDKLICLNERDSLQLQRTYGRRGTHLLPMAMHDRLPKDMPITPQPAGERYALFVGGTFYANRQGIEWYVEHVAARAPIKTFVVGKGFEQWKDRLERNGNVEVIGGVDSIVPWYVNAHFVIAPIFDGSGMKTKVAEALMFGKRIVGTAEAFTGYDDVVPNAGAVCQTPEEFLRAMHAEMLRGQGSMDPGLRGMYERKYSFAAARDRLAQILGQCDSA